MSISRPWLSLWPPHSHNHGLALADVVEPIARPSVDSQLRDPLTHRSCVSEVSISSIRSSRTLMRATAWRSRRRRSQRLKGSVCRTINMPALYRLRYNMSRGFGAVAKKRSTRPPGCPEAIKKTSAVAASYIREGTTRAHNLAVRFRCPPLCRSVYTMPSLH